MAGRSETVMEALFALLQGAYPWVVSSRRLKLWDDVPLASRPAMFQFEGSPNQYAWPTNRINPVITIGADIIIYTNAKDPSIIGATELNEIGDAIDAALAPPPGDPTGRQTLGGLVHHVRIEGVVRTVPGDLDGDGMLWIPLRIIMPF